MAYFATGGNLHEEVVVLPGNRLLGRKCDKDEKMERKWREIFLTIYFNLSVFGMLFPYSQ